MEKSFRKPVVLLLLAAILCFGIHFGLAETVFTNREEYVAGFSQDASFEKKIAVLQEAFPNGTYWNKHSETQLGSGEQWKVTVNNKSYYVSTVGCVYKSGAKHNGTKNDTSICQSNHYPGTLGGVQCTGFARAVFNLLWNMEEGSSKTTSVKYKDDSNCLGLLLPGDVIWTGGHMLVVTEIHDDGTIKYVDCNWDSHCKIAWSHTAEQEKLSFWKGKMKSNGYVSLHDPDASYAKRDKKPDEDKDITTEDEYVVKYSGGLRIRADAGTSAKVLKVAEKGTHFWVSTNHTKTADGYTWGYMRLADNTTKGWMAIDNKDYCQKVEYQEIEGKQLGFFRVIGGAGALKYIPYEMGYTKRTVRVNVDISKLALGDIVEVKKVIANSYEVDEPGKHQFAVLDDNAYVYYGNLEFLFEKTSDENFAVNCTQRSIQLLPFADAGSVRGLDGKTKLFVVSSYVNKYGNIWYGVADTEGGEQIGYVNIDNTTPYTEETYTVKIINVGKGTGTANPKSGTEGTLVTLTARPKSGYRFKEWKVISGGVTIVNDQFKIGTDDVEIQAVFEEIRYKGVKLALNGSTQTAKVIGPASKTVKILRIPEVYADNGKAYRINEIAANAFKDCTRLTKVTFNEYIKTIGNKAFYGCTRLKTVYGLTGVETIGAGAFQKCKALPEFTIPATVKSIGSKAFYECTKLRLITIKTTKLEEDSVGENAFGKNHKKAVYKCPKRKLEAYRNWMTKKGVPKMSQIQ